MRARLLLLALAAAMTTVAVATEEECSPPIADCKCGSGQLTCRGCSALPAAAPPAASDLQFLGCSFSAPLEPLPYTAAASVTLSSSSGLTLSPGLFRSLGRLLTLNLSHNGLRSLPDGLFEGLANLTTLVLSANRLTALPVGLFAPLPSLQTLEVDSNAGLVLGGLDDLQGSLMVLKLQNCSLTALPAALSSLTALRRLDLNDNPLGELPAFPALPALQELHLDSCELRTLGAIPAPLDTLDLANNVLEEVGEDVLEESKGTLTRLDVRNNRLQALPAGLASWGGLGRTDLSGNPWRCDCGLAWLLTLHQSNHRQNITCASPPELTGSPALNATAALSCPASSSTTVVVAVVVPLPIVCTLLLVYSVYKLVQGRRRRDPAKSVRYSAVYRDTVETVSRPGGRPISEL